MSLQQAWALRLFSTPSRDLAEIGPSLSFQSEWRSPSTSGSAVLTRWAVLIRAANNVKNATLVWRVIQRDGSGSRRHIDSTKNRGSGISR